MRVLEVSHIQDLDRYRAEWDALIGKATNGDFFDTCEWHRTWLAHFWNDKPLAYLLLEKRGAISAVAPFVVDRRRELWCGESLVFPINKYSSRADLIRAGDGENVWSPFLDYLCSTRRRIKLGLLRVPETSGTTSQLSACTAQHHLSTLQFDRVGSPVIHLGCSWDTYLSRRSPHWRREMHRKEKRLEREGRIEYRVCSSVAECDPGMQDIMQIEAASWKQEAGTSFARCKGLQAFYRDLAVACAARGWLRIHLLSLDSKPIAYVYGMLHKGVFNALKTSYSETHSRLSPGAMLFSYVLKNGCQEGWSALDLLGDQSRWKLELADSLRRHVDICVFSRSLPRCRFCTWCQNRLKPNLKKRIPAAVKWKTWFEQAVAGS